VSTHPRLDRVKDRYASLGPPEHEPEPGATLGEKRGNKHRLRFHASKLTDAPELELQLVVGE
jgi:hypothetical protein